MEYTYIYTLNDPRTNEPRYVGKSDKPEARCRGHIREGRELINKGKNPTRKKGWIAGLLKQGLEPYLEIVDEVEVKNWEFWEKHYISLYKSWGFNLTNLSDGGENPPVLIGNKNPLFGKYGKDSPSYGNKFNVGRKHPKEEIERRKISQTGQKRTEETKQKMRNARVGMKFSDEHKNNLRLKKLGVKHTAEQKEKRIVSSQGEKNPFFGKVHTKEILDAMSREVYTLNEKGCVVEKFSSLKTVAEHYGVTKWYIVEYINKMKFSKELGVFFADNQVKRDQYLDEKDCRKKLN